MAETVINKNQAGSGIWTSDNLIAGTNVSIAQVQQPVIDENTTGLYHFDESYVDAITGTNPYNIENVSTIQYTEGKFGKALRFIGGYAYFGPQEYSQTAQSFTYDVWLRPDTTSVNYYTFPIWTQNWQRTGIEINNSRQVLKIGIRVSGRTSGGDPEVPLPTIVWGDWVHLAYVNDASNRKVYIFLNGKKAYEETVATNYNTRVWGPVDNNVCNWDELRISNVARWTSDFTPFSEPYSSGGTVKYAINNTQDISGKQDALTGATGYDATKNQVLKNATGTLEWGEGSDVAVDNKTIIQDPVTKEISTYGTLVNTSVDESGESGELGEPVVRYNWEGTKAEYEKLKKNNLINDDWYYRITDDVEPASIVTLLRINLVTQEEYDNLTEEEKLSGTYGIIDDESYGG